MRNKILKLLPAILAVLMVFSCTEDYLEQVNPNELTSDSWYSTLDECEQGVNAVYNQFKHRYVMLIDKETQRSDLAHKDGWSDLANVFYLKTWNNSKNEIQEKWAALYKGIYRANQAIEGLEYFKAANPDVDEESWNDLYAQAVFFRGIFHYYLYSSFNEGSVIIRDKVPVTDEDYDAPLSSADDVFSFFMNDLQFAYTEGFLPTEWAVGEEGKITRGAVAAVIGQAYLFDAQYDSARKYLGDVINNSDYGYALTDDPKSNVTTYDEFNSESILEISYSMDLKPETGVNDDESVSNKFGDYVSPLEAQWGAGMHPSYWLQMAYKEDSMDVTDDRNLTSAIDIPTGDVLLTSDGLADSIELRKYNIRASAYIAFPDDEASSYYLTRPAWAWSFNNANSATFKMLSNCNEYTDESLPNSETYKSGVNHRVIRLADVYLMYAEALVDGGNNDGGVVEALSYINKVRYRSALLLCGMPSAEFPFSDFDDETYTAIDVMDQLMYVERPLEISIQGHATRHLDLRRWGIYKERLEELATNKWALGSYPYELWSDVDVDGVMKRKYLYPGANKVPQERLTNPDGGSEIIRWGCIINYDTYFDNAVGWDLKDYAETGFKWEYQDAAVNYVESLHAYWPIPLVEETTNPRLYE